jgi:hypothetical protein
VTRWQWVLVHPCRPGSLEGSSAQPCVDGTAGTTAAFRCMAPQGAGETSLRHPNHFLGSLNPAALGDL